MPHGRPRLYADNATRQRAYRQRQAPRQAPDAALIRACCTPEPGETWEDFISRVAFFLSATERQRNALHWTQSRLIVAAARAARLHPARPKWRADQFRHRLISDLRTWWATHKEDFHPKPTVLTNALKMADVWPDLFAEQDSAPDQGALAQSA